MEQDSAGTVTRPADDHARRSPLEPRELLDAMDPDERAEVEHEPGARYDPETGEDLSPAIDRLQRALTDLGVPGHLVARVVRRGRERPSYELILKPDDQVATLGRASKVLQPREVQARLLDATGHAMRVPKLDDWRPVAELIVRAAEHDDEPDADWRWRLRQYLADSTRDRDEAAKRSEPFQDDAGRPHVHREKVRPVPAPPPRPGGHRGGRARRLTRPRLRERRRLVDQRRRQTGPDDLLARAGRLGPVTATCS